MKSQRNKPVIFFVDDGGIVMKLIMNLPTTTEGKKQFNEQFSKIQAKLIVECIKDLNIDDTSKKNLCVGVLDKLKELSKERNDSNV